MIHFSKKDGWLVVIMAVVAVVIALQLVWGIYLLSSSNKAQVGWTMILISAITGIGLLGLTYPLYYQITASNLSIRSGFLQWRIPLESINEVRPTRNPLSSPALSLDRLQVVYWQGERAKSILVSPQDKARFMSDLVASEMNLQVRGERVVRVP